MARISFMSFVEKQLGKFARFIVYVLLEWVLIFILFIDGFLAFFANEFARFFELKIPCLLCTRIDHVLVRRAADFYYNDSICENHKKDVSYLAYCHDHKKLSHIRKMCDSCLLSFSSEKPSDLNVESLLDNDQDHHNHNHHKRDDSLQLDKNSQNRCACCGEPLKMKLFAKGKGPSIATQAPSPSPRAAFVNLRHERNRSMELPHSRLAELKFPSKETEDDDGMNSPNFARAEGDDTSELDRTPIFGKGNKFFGIPLTDSANATPRTTSRVSRKSPLEKTEFAAELAEETSPENEPLLSLYTELDKERSASAVAANNAMAMITRLQAEKAEFQMEALQYQRMMEEQAEYDQEALQAANELAAKREEDIKVLEAELDVYREKFGLLSEEDYDIEYYHDMSSTYNERSEFYSPTHSNGEIPNSNTGTPRSQRGFQIRRFCDLNLNRLKGLNMNFLADEGARCSSVSSSDNVWPAQENKLMRLMLQLQERVKGLETDRELMTPDSPHRDTEKEKLLTEICDNLGKLRDFIATPFHDDHEA